jgi:hypothetical protein
MEPGLSVSEITKKPGISYALTDQGIELPVIDITHPAFKLTITPEEMREVCKHSLDIAKVFNAFPQFFQQMLTRMLRKRSAILGGGFLQGSQNTYLGGINSFIAKLGSENIGGGRKRIVDREIAKGISCVAMRIRLRDFANLQADVLIPRLQNRPSANVHFINIAGGTAIDSLNTVILLHKKHPEFVRSRAIIITVLDGDDIGPNFGKRCMQALQEKGAPLDGLDMKFEHLRQDWSETAALAKLLEQSKAAGDIVIGSSEGGLFEYGSDEDIMANLQVLHQGTRDDAVVAGDIIRDLETVDPSIPILRNAFNLQYRFLGLQKLKSLAQRAGWTIDSMGQSENPVHEVFSLKK